VERLFRQHVLPGLERAHRPLDVERVGQRDVDRVELGIGKQLVVASVRALDLVLARVLVGTLLVAAAHCNDLGHLGLASAVEYGWIDARGGQESEANGLHESIIYAPAVSVVASVAKDLQAAVGAEIVAPTAAYLSDETEARGLRGRADAVALPRSAEEVAEVVAWCYEHGVAVVPRGGGTGYAAGAVPLDGGVVLSLERLDRVRSFDP